ncbi:CAP domain-containing protein [Ornithinibacillus salinisoli]|uniref:CAP domain-containing protein n=1 Tax=Ornithinibacillus salinisoli TaxID=1848459 RepID=A0ABW4VWE5_9BACI
MQKTKQLFIPLLLIIFGLVLTACANNDATNDQNGGDNGNISSISTNSPDEDYSQTQRPGQQGQGYGNNLRDIGMHSGEGNQQRQQQYPPIPQQPNQGQGDQPPQEQQVPRTETPDEPGAGDAQQGQGHNLNEFERTVVELTNQERRNAGLNDLQIDNELSRVARMKSVDMQENDYFSHNSPTYGSPFDMMAQFGIDYRSAGENIAAGQRSPEEVVQAWMNSEGHRENILNGGFTHIGVGFEDQGNNWTQMFIRK